jgi:hypothetical protein
MLAINIVNIMPPINIICMILLPATQQLWTFMATVACHDAGSRRYPFHAYHHHHLVREITKERLRRETFVPSAYLLCIFDHLLLPHPRHDANARAQALHLRKEGTLAGAHSSDTAARHRTARSSQPTNHACEHGLSL